MQLMYVSRVAVGWETPNCASVLNETRTWLLYKTVMMFTRIPPDVTYINLKN